MQLLRPLLALAAFLFSGAPANCANQAIVPAEQIKLFNGTNLTGFYTWLVDAKRDDPRRVFTVTNGMIRISGDGLGYLSTDQAYQNYHLIAEFKWGRTNWAWGNRLRAAAGELPLSNRTGAAARLAPLASGARDSGIFLHSAGPEGNSFDGQGAFKAAIECNIFQGATGDFLLIRGTNSDGSPLHPQISAEAARERDAEGWPTWERGGKSQTLARWGRLNWFGKDRRWEDALDFRGQRDLEKPYGDWNRLECRCDGGHIQIILNGTMVNEAFDASPRSGKILLQCEGSEIFFRRLDLLPLKKITEPAPPPPPSRWTR